MNVNRPSRAGLIRFAVIGMAAILATVCWGAVLVVTDVDQGQQLRQGESHASNLALAFEEQVYRQVLSIDQMLYSVKTDWERDPNGWSSANLQRRAGAVSDLVSDLMLLDYRGRVVAAMRPRNLGADLAGRHYFESHRSSDSFGALIAGPFQTNGSWYLSISRRINAAHGVFAGVVVAQYDLDALMRDMSQAELGPRGIIMLVGRDGMVRALTVHGVQGPGADITGSALYRAMFTNSGASWVGPSGPDGDIRIHAWRPIPGQDMTLVVGLDRAAALAPAHMRKQEALVGATAITLLVMLVALGLGSMVSSAAARIQRMRQDRTVLEAANLQLAHARELADEKSVQLGMTLAGMSDGISMVDAELRLVQWNEQFARLAGLPHAALRVGLPLADILRIRAQYRQTLAPGEVESGEVEAEVAYELEQARSGAWPPVVTEQRPSGVVLELRRTRLPDGGWVTLYSDITARQQAEDAQSRAREQAEVAAQEKSRFVAIVSHEIRTPLNVALNALGLLDGSSLSQAQRKWVETGLQAGESLLGLLNDILDLSRMQVGRMQLRPAPFQLQPLLEGVAEMFRDQALERGVELSVVIAPGVPGRLMTDSGRLRQALMNLVNNAAKFAEPGPATIRVGFTTVDGPRQLRFAVRDCGPDIPDLDRARLFRPFSQLEQAGGAGTGLGLAICQLLANLLGGQIGCNRASGGKEFWITLPADVMDVPAEPPPLPAIQPAPRWLPRTRVLLVEDVPANQMIVATLLRREGHMVDVAGSGLQALDMIRSQPYDMAFLDIFMPGIDGLETARRVRQMPDQGRTLPLVALTANVSGHDREQYLGSGMNDLVSKPVQRATLLAAVARNVWAARRNRRDESTIVQNSLKAAERADCGIDVAQVQSWCEGLHPDVSDALFSDCLRDLHEMLLPLSAALRARDQAQIVRVTHAMAGVAGNYGLSGLAAGVRAIAADPVYGAHADGVVARLGQEIDRAAAAIREFSRAATA